MRETEKATWKVLNPQQELFLQCFLDPQAETFGSYRKSALKAGFAEDYADNISSLMPKWLEESLEDSSLVRKALDNLSDFIGDGENKNLQWDATKFTLSRLAKGKFSERSELTGDKGQPIQIQFSNTFGNLPDKLV